MRDLREDPIAASEFTFVTDPEPKVEQLLRMQLARAYGKALNDARFAAHITDNLSARLAAQAERREAAIQDVADRWAIDDLDIGDAAGRVISLDEAATRLLRAIRGANVSHGS